MNDPREDIGILIKANSDEVTGRQDFSLTRLEGRIIALVEDGYTDKYIAKELTLSRQAVANHLSGIFKKLGVANRLELVLFSLHHRVTHTPRRVKAERSHLCPP